MAAAEEEALTETEAEVTSVEPETASVETTETPEAAVADASVEASEGEEN
jgi:hypothetical protein